MSNARVAGMLFALSCAACGARTGLRQPDAAVDDVVVVDRPDVATGPDACAPVRDRCVAVEVCGNGDDDDCNGLADENCPCEPGRVQSCFLGPPGRRNVGACRDGAQVCEMSGRWGGCTGGIAPRPGLCNGLDNECTGCSALRDCEIQCPGPGDPRVPDGRPLAMYALRGEDFYPGPATRWAWTVSGGPCDTLSRNPSFTVSGSNTRNATFFPRLSGDYTVGLTVVTPLGHTLQCSWIVHVQGPGLRVEMCYPENTTIDLDLYLSRPGYRGAWYPPGGDVYHPVLETCGWHDCEANIRGRDENDMPVPRADWGYMPSPVSECIAAPQGDQWRNLGFCGNPRLDIDNNLSEGTGLPENINVDSPRDGETFRVMVNNFSGPTARPLVNIYCAGRRLATYGAAPDIVPRFTGAAPPAIGAMWRVVDVTTRVDARGATTCDLQQVHPPGTTRGYDVTYGDRRF